MKRLSTQINQGVSVIVNAPDTNEDFNYLCNLALAQNMFVDPNWMFFKLLNEERHYIRHITAMMTDDFMYGLAIVWDYTKRAVEQGDAPDEETLFSYGLIKHSIGIYVPTHYRRSHVGAILANQTMESFEEPVFTTASTESQQSFWSSPLVDKTYLQFMLTENESVRVRFKEIEGE